MRLRLIILILVVVLATATSILMAVDNAPKTWLSGVVIDGELPLATESPPAYLVIKAFVDERRSTVTESLPVDLGIEAFVDDEHRSTGQVILPCENSTLTLTMSIWDCRDCFVENFRPLAFAVARECVLKMPIIIGSSLEFAATI